MLAPIHSACMSVFPAAVCLLLFRLVRTEDRGQVRGQAWMYGILLSALPLAMSILEGNRTVPRTQFALPVVAAFLAVFCGAEAEKRKKLLTVLCCLMIALQAALTVRLLHTDNMRNRFDSEIQERIIADLDGRGSDGKPIAFIGRPEHPGSATAAAVRLLRAYSGTGYRAVTEEGMLYRAEELAAKAPAWPADGYILETDEMIVIKLSE